MQVQGQVVTVGANNLADVQNMVQNVLVNNSSSPVTNINYQGFYGANAQIGTFTTTNGIPNIGFNSGMILTTGPIQQSTGDCAGFPSAGLGGPGDPQLSAVVAANNDCAGTTATFDRAVLEFVFTPTIDTVSFRYFFASTEFTSYTCSQFNDVFGFFISGPNPQGGNYNNLNIALIPGTNTPVAINSVHDGSGTASTCFPCPPRNVQFYNNNEAQFGCNFPQFPWDGFTKVLTARAAVVPCSTYFIRLAIADVGDGVLDSAVFLEANSFNSGSPSATVTDGQGFATVGQSATYESCDQDVAFIIRRPGNSPIGTTYTANYTLGGTATPGVDYNIVPPAISIPPGQDSTILYLSAIWDGALAEPNIETVILTIDPSLSCGSSIPLVTNIINVPPVVINSITPSNTVCGTPTVNFSVNASGGRPGSTLSYEWSNKYFEIVSTSPSFSIPVTSDTCFYVVVRDPICALPPARDTVCIDIRQPDPNNPLTITLQNNFTTCAGGPPINLAPVVNGGTGEYDFSWSGGGGTDSLLTLPNPVSGTYTVTVNDGCNSKTASVNVVVGGPVPNVTAVVTASCGGLPDGGFTTVATSGIAPYTFQLASPPPTATQNQPGKFGGLPAGAYTVQVTDNVGCTATINAIVPAPTLLDLTIVSVTDNICFGQATGQVVVQATNVTGAASYTINTVPPITQGAPVFNNLPAGNYVITVNDAANCPISRPVEVKQPPQLVVNLANSSNITCNGLSNGNFLLNITGGSPGYTITGLNPPLPPTSNPQFTNRPAGSYLLRVTDLNGCSQTISVTLNQPPPLTLSAADQSVICFGGATGSVTLTAQGGNGGYVYEQLTPAGSTQPNPLFANLVAGNYVFRVSDSEGCTATTSVTVNQPPQLTIQVVSTTNNPCAGNALGSVQLSSAGGLGTQTFSLPGFGTNTTGAFANLPAGSYTATVTDNNQCTSTANFTITQPPVLTLTVVNTVEPLCANDTNGEITVAASGGTPGYQYQLGTAPRVNSPAFTGLGAGTYSLTVYDANNCTAQIAVSIGQPNALEAFATFQPNPCFGLNQASITVTASGGKPPYTYNGTTNPVLTGLTAGTYTINVRDANQCLFPVTVTLTDPPLLVEEVVQVKPVSCFGGSDGNALIRAIGGTKPYLFTFAGTGTTQFDTAFVAQNLTAGTYTVQVTDVKGCTATISFEITQPTQLVIDNVSSQPVVCFGQANGTVAVAASGGVPAYIYSVGSIVQPGLPNFSGLLANTYPVVVTDANGCTASTTVTVAQPPALVIDSVVVVNQSCFDVSDGSIRVFASGGVGGYSYRIAPGAGFGPGSQFNNLAAQTYAVTVRDANGCEVSQTAGVNKPPKLTLAPLLNDTLCWGESRNLVAETANAVGPVLYEWRDLATNTVVSNLVSAAVAPGQTTTYQVKVSDNCYTLTQTVTLKVTPNNLTIAGLVSSLPPVVCPGDLLTLTAAVTGGTGSYNYQWSTGGSNTAVLQWPITGLTAIGLTVSDGCQTRDTTITFQVFPAPSVSVPAVPAICQNETAFLEAFPSGGNGSWTYAWRSPGNTIISTDAVVSVTPQSTTIYTVTVTDGCGRTATATATVVVKPRPVANAGPDKTICAGESTLLQASLNLNNACAVRWLPAIGLSDPFALQPTANPNITTTYTVYPACDGCEGTPDEVTVFVRSRPLVALNQTQFDRCPSDAAVNFSTVVVGGLPPYQYAWAPATGLSTPNTPNPTAQPAQTTTYTLTVTDANGCTAEPVNVKVVIHPKPVADAGPDRSLCFAGDSVRLEGAALADGVGYLYSWSPALGLNDPSVRNPIARPDATTTYSLVVTSLPWGCVSEPDVVTVTVNGPGIANAGSDRTICQGESIVLGTPAQPGVTYAWTPEIGLDDPTKAQPVATTPYTLVYMVTALRNGCPGAVDFVTVNVKPRPTVATSGGQSGCPGDVVPIKAVVNGAPEPYVFEWFPPTGIINPNSMETQAVIGGSTRYVYARVIADGCEVVYQDSIQLQSNALAVPDIEPSVLRICQGSGVQLPTTVTGGPGTYLFDWQPKAGLSDPASLTPVAAPALTTTYTLSIEAGVCLLTDTVRVEVVLQPEVWLNTQVSALCGNEPTILKAFSNLPEHQFSWAPATGLNTTTGSSVLAQPAVPTTYTVTATNTLGCTATASVSVMPNGIAPIAAFDLTQPTNCGSTRVSFLDLSQNAIAWAWDFGDGSPVVNTPSPVHDYSSPGEYQVSLTVTSESGCVSTVVASAPVLISGVLEARFESSLRPNTDSLILDQTRVIFRDQSIGAITAWFWDFGDGNHAAEPSPVHLYRAAGDYTVVLTVTDAAGCVDTAMKSVYKIREPLLRYPNVFTPNGDGVNDTWKPIYDGNRQYTYTITDRWGISMHTGTQESRGWNGQKPDGSEALNGVYFYIVKFEDRTYSGSLTLLRD